MTGRMWVVTPSYRPVGGVVKILDYVTHARSMGWEVLLACPRGPDPESPLWRLHAFRGLLEDPGVRILPDARIAPTPDDLVFFSWPSHVVDIMARLPDGFSLHRLVHIVQNTRHANPTFADGWGVRALARPMTRIMINEQVAEAVADLQNPTGICEIIPLGHAADFFAVDREPGLPAPVRVGYTTWKSDLGDRVATALADDPRFTFRALRDPADWDELRELYASSDVFLCTPGPQEGFYLPGLEAMAARCLVLTPDVGGNLAYAFFGENCIEVPFEDVDGYVAGLRAAAELPDDEIARLRAAGWDRVRAHALSVEAERFASLVDRIEVADGLRVVAPPRPVLARPTADPAFRVLTGIPRSGTTLATHLLNELDDVVALSEPLRPPDFMDARSPDALLDQLEDFFAEQRERAMTLGEVATKLVDGRDADNYVGDRAEAGPRPDLAQLGRRVLDRPVTDGVRIVIKDVAMCSALVGHVASRFPTAAIVRNPAAVLASWDTVDMPVRDGHSPHAEWFDADLATRLDVGDRRERQLRLLDWWFGQLERHLPPDRVLRYEDVIASRGAALAVLVPEAGALAAELAPRNDANPAYRGVDMDEIVELLLARSDAAWWRFYSRADVDALRSRHATSED